MTGEQKREQLERRAQAQAYTCASCRRSLCRPGAQPQRAHRIPQGKRMERWVKRCLAIVGPRGQYKPTDILDHDRNVAAVCSLECNGKVALGHEHRAERAILFAQILNELEIQGV